MPGSEGEVVRYREAGGVAWLTLADGDRGNPVDPALVAALQEGVRRARADRARVIVLAAEGRYFSVGGDLAAFSAVEDLSRYVDDLADGLHRVVLDLVRGDAVVISAVQGPAAGAGFPLAAAADLVVAASSAAFSLGYTRVGLTVDGGSSLLVHTLGLHRVLRLALLNDVLSAEEAHRAGLVARICDPGALTSTVTELAERLAQGPRAAQAAVKRLLRATADDAPERALRAETVSIREHAALPDAPEGIGAFLEKRSPAFGAD